MKELADKIENDERILQFRFHFNNTPVWPFIRFFIYRTISSKVFGSTLPANKNRFFVIKKHINELINNVKKSFNLPFLWEQKNFLYFYYGIGNVITADGKIYNRICDWFVMEYNERSGVIETGGQTIHKEDSFVDKKYKDPIDFFINVLCFLRKTDPKDVLMADALMQYLCDECKINISATEVMQIKKYILFFSKQIRYMRQIYPKMFRRIKPQIVFFEEGCYGGSNAYLIKILHEMGVKTAEIQHGWVGKNHNAYFHSEFLCNNSEYASYMPDYFLGWSEYWLERISIPGTKVPIGNPQFWREYPKFLKRVGNVKGVDGQKVILWIAFENNDENIRSLDEFIMASDNEYNIRIRLHPLHRILKNEYQKYENNSMIIMDELPTVYDSFSMADYVVANDSTVIYEAVALGLPTYILRNGVSSYLDVLDVAPSFENADELLNLLHAHSSLMCDLNGIREKLFGDAWKRNFSTFIESL